MKEKVLGGVLLLRVPFRWRPPLAMFYLVAGSHLTLPFVSFFLSWHGMSRWRWLEFTLPFGQLTGYNVLIGPRRSKSEEVQNILDVYNQEISSVPMGVRERLRAACDTDDVDASWQIWSKEAEARLIRGVKTEFFVLTV